MTTRPLLSVVALVASACAGCSSDNRPDYPRAAVSGSITLDGVPLSVGVVRFVPSDGTRGQKVSIPVKDGKFDAEQQLGPFLGVHRVEIESSDDGGYAFDDETALDRLTKQDELINVIVVPHRYNKFSQLKEEVEADRANNFTFELTREES